MNYLNYYNISDEQIVNIKDVLKRKNINSEIFIYNSEKIIEILNLFVSLGVRNLYEIIITSPSMFCDTVSSIKQRLDSYEDKNELAELLNEDANNLFLIDLM